MRPASSAHDGVAGHHAVVTAVGVGQKHLLVVLEEILRSVAPAAEGEVEQVVRMGRVTHVDPHARPGAMPRVQHGHDGVVGGHHVRSPHFIAHEFIKRFGQIGHVAAPDRLRRPRDLEPLPREDVFQSIVRKVIVELAGHDVAQQTRSGQPLVDGRFRLGRRLDLWVLAVDLADRTGVLVAPMMDALEVAREVFDLPALLLADLLAFGARSMDKRVPRRSTRAHA